MTALSSAVRLLGRLRWLMSLETADLLLAAEVIRVLGSRRRADAFLEDQHVMTTRYLRTAYAELSESELNEVAWKEMLAGLPAQLVPRSQPTVRVKS